MPCVFWGPPLTSARPLSRRPDTPAPTQITRKPQTTRRLVLCDNKAPPATHTHTHPTLNVHPEARPRTIMRKPEQPHEALEQELEALASADGHDLGEDEVRKRMRVIKNRLSAKKSREQARTYVQQLQSSISALMAQHQALARRLAAVEYENATLRHQLYYSQPLTPPQNHIDKPAVLSKSPQLDAVLVLVWAAMVLLSGLVPVLRGATRNQPPPHTPTPASAPQAVSSPGPSARRARRWLRRAGLLACVEHICRCIRPPPPHPHHPAAAAAA